MLGSLIDYKESNIGTKVMTDQDRPKEIDGRVDWAAFDEMREEFPICVDHKAGMVSFKVMNKPASEGGSGAQWTDMVHVGLHILKYLNNKYPCRENAITITKLEEALMWQEKRTKDRVNRNVEGRNEL